jgi:hypothetical protein
MDLLFDLGRWLKATLEQFAPSGGAFLPGVGLLLMLSAAGFALHSWNSTRGQVRAVATVTEDVPSFAPSGGVVYRSRLRFRTPTGGLAQVLDDIARPEPEFAVGDDLPVLYPPGQPRSAVIATVWRLYRTAIWLAIGGVVAFDLGWFLRLVIRGRKVKLGD